MSRKKSVLTLLLLGALGLLAVSSATGASEARKPAPRVGVSGTIGPVCGRNHGDGTLRFIRLGQHCKKGETFFYLHVRFKANPKGLRGAKGFPGPQGAQGAKGEQGLMGLQGVIGATGVQGAVGPIGPLGPAGEDGTDGADGASIFAAHNEETGCADIFSSSAPNEVLDSICDGAKGDTGATGATGAQGPKGDDGATGPAGAQGATGPAGAQGPVGPKGDDGATGPAGPKGSDGATGAAGPQGIQGVPGSKGDSGATGPAGPTGPEGPMGDIGSIETVAGNFVQGEKTIIVNCPAGKHAVSGGYNIQGSVTASYRSDSAGNDTGTTSWTVTQTSGNTGSGKVYVYCA